MWIIAVIIIAVFLGVLVYYYNLFVTLKKRVENSWSQIEVQLKRRYDLIPNLEATVKGYMGHERKTMENIAKARARLIRGPPEQRAEASKKVSESLKTIFAVAEDYPRLKASKNFKQLQLELSDTETKIAHSRQFYNDIVMRYNQQLSYFPSNMFAKLFAFRQRDFFKTADEESLNVKVNFK